MQFGDLLENPYSRSRLPVIGRRGAVATAQPLAAQAGMAMLHDGGNAVDAALATAIALTIVEPTSNGLGADAFALIWADGKLHGLNASGRAPMAMNANDVRAAGHTSMPDRGWHSVTVPGAVSAWVALHERFGRLPFARLFGPAIALAEGGFPASPVVSRYWRAAQRTFAAELHGPQFESWHATFAPTGEGPRPAEIVRLPDQARTLRLIAGSGGEAFYRGELAAAIDAFAVSTGGFIRAADMAAHEATWVDPIATNYRGYDVWEIPPNGQGITALNALNILEGFDLAALGPESPEAWHLQIEAIKLAFTDSLAYVADPGFADVPVAGLLDKEYAAQRRRLITDTALDPAPGDPPRGGTVYLCAADGDGTMISYIQSDYKGFGSAVTVPGTGIVLQNRGANFSLVEGHPNELMPGKRPYHTIIPGFLTRDGGAIGPFGVMGGFMQPQGHLQVLVRAIDQGRHPQAALDAPRFRWDAGRSVIVEPSVPESLADALRARGHDVTIEPERSAFGRGQIIWRSGEALIAGSESRADGQALVC